MSSELRVNYFNGKLSCWEPLLEPFKIHCHLFLPVLLSPICVSEDLNASIPLIASGPEVPELELGVSVPSPLYVNVTSALIASLVKLSASFSKIENFLIRQNPVELDAGLIKSVTGYKIRNDCGVEIVCQFPNSDDVVVASNSEVFLESRRDSLVDIVGVSISLSENSAPAQITIDLTENTQKKFLVHEVRYGGTPSRWVSSRREGESKEELSTRRFVATEVIEPLSDLASSKSLCLIIAVADADIMKTISLRSTLVVRNEIAASLEVSFRNPDTNASQIHRTLSSFDSYYFPSLIGFNKDFISVRMDAMTESHRI
jgi:hypothetical protein